MPVLLEMIDYVNAKIEEISFIAEHFIYVERYLYIVALNIIDYVYSINIPNYDNYDT